MMSANPKTNYFTMTTIPQLPTPNSELRISPLCYPARPVNGGPLPKALPKSGDWTLEGKYNGWRAWGHNPTRRMFNRKRPRSTFLTEQLQGCWAVP